MSLLINMKSDADIMKVFTLEMDSSDTIQDIIAELQGKEGILPDQYELYYQEKHLSAENGASIRDYKMKDGATIFLMLHPMEIFVEMEDGLNFPVQVESYDTVYSVKAKIYEASGIDPECQKLSLDNVVLEDNQTLLQYGIYKGSKIMLKNIGIYKKSFE